MDNIPEWVKFAGIVFGGPLYFYFIVRWFSSAITRSIYEVKREFQPLQKKEVG